MSADSQSRRVVIFSGKSHTPSMIEHVEAVADAFPHWHLTVLQEHPPGPPWPHYLRTKLRRLRRQPVSYPLELAWQAAAWFRRTHRPSATGAVRLPDQFEDIARPNVDVRRCESLHHPDTTSLVHSLEPWLGLAIGAPILEPHLHRIPRHGTINLHKSLLPHYRGQPPGFWELHDQTDRTGATAHRVDDGIDTGDIIAQAALPVPPYATPEGLAAQLDRLGTDVLIDALRRIDRGDTAPTPQHTTHAMPNRRPPWLTIRSTRKRLTRRRSPRRSRHRPLRELAKRIVLVAYVHLWAPIRNRVRRLRGRCHATVLLYHRVSDDHLDSITVGIEQFNRHLEILKRHYDVLDLPAFLRRRGQPRRRPCAVITFDDGYQDNLLAAMLLRRAATPAAFFLSTDIITNNAAFPHDLQRLHRRVPALSWDQVRRMAGWGFVIGNHTATHARLSRLPLNQAIREIRSAEQELDRRLDRNGHERCLAYPYGNPGDITDDVRQALKANGIDYCLSAYGGVNPPDFDPLNILRQGVDHSFSPLAFRAAVEGWPSKA
ncbi:MAG: polysaccharide deacetylase family protein [Phycisphaerales bacterium]|nr:MAG: polysaccharide deacetylase family protein [Phycisphaerales bacterium]